MRKIALGYIWFSLTALAIQSCKGQSNNAVKDGYKLSFLFFNDTIISYNGVLDKETALKKITYDTAGIKNLIEENKKKYKDSLRVFLKLTKDMEFVEPLVNISNTINNTGVLYSADELSIAEKSFFNTNNFSWEPPQPVAIQTPGSVISQALPENNAMLITIDKNNSVSYTILMSGQNNTVTKITPPVTKNLAKIIADFQKKYPGQRIQYLIKGHPNSTYPPFEKVIEALKQNNIYKYNLVTAQ